MFCSFAKVIFIDFGNTELCTLDYLKQMRGVSAQYIEDPPYCYQCALAQVQPSQVNAPDGIWTAKAKKLFDDKTDGKNVKIKVN